MRHVNIRTDMNYVPVRQAQKRPPLDAKGGLCVILMYPLGNPTVLYPEPISLLSPNSDYTYQISCRLAKDNGSGKVPIETVSRVAPQKSVQAGKPFNANYPIPSQK